jgi:uroporphyrinogen-III decarboxylase
MASCRLRTLHSENKSSIPYASLTQALRYMTEAEEASFLVRELRWTGSGMSLACQTSPIMTERCQGHL